MIMRMMMPLIMIMRVMSNDDELTYPSPTKRPSQCPDELLFLEETLEPPMNQGR